MRRVFGTLAFIVCIVIANIAVSGEKPFQHLFAEVLYEPIPPKHHKLIERLERWDKVAEAELEKIKSSNHPKVAAWYNAIRALDSEDGVRLLNHVNRITNEAVAYVDDYHHYHKDFWAPPYETLVEGGDCEDIALLKAVALHIHGWNMVEKGHILIGMIDWKGKQTAHAVLHVRDHEHDYVMRSINHDVPTFDEMGKIMKPIYMMSSKNLIVFKDSNKHLAYNLFGEDGNLNFATAAGE